MGVFSVAEIEFEKTTPLRRARNHYWLARGVISVTVAGTQRKAVEQD
jgi:hypothetical protein